MRVEYHKWFSPNLGHEMEMKVYGHYGKPVLVFPCQGGKFYEWEDFGMIEKIRWFIDSGKIKLFTVDSIDNQSWVNYSIHPGDRAKRHESYDKYIVDEVAPFIKEHCGHTEQKILTTGCSMGAYHAGNFLFRHPEIIDACICLSGLFQLSNLLGDYCDDLVYFNSPIFFLPNLNDHKLLKLYRKSKIVICAGQGAWEDLMIQDAKEMKKVLDSKGIPSWIDFWGHNVNHDWPWWYKQLPYFLGKII
ncbi:MAG: esterase family protein [Ignavibacteriales bacterium]|nr:esterase family protein [Ignavibacteriales bacterium]